MLGWYISVYRQDNGGAAPATAASQAGLRLAVWQTGLTGPDWINELVKANKATDLGGNGYPCRYTATAENIVPQIVDEPTEAEPAWETKIDRPAAEACPPREWLLIEVWDAS